MIPIFRHELRGYFHSLTAYVFGGFLLAFVGIGALLYNIQAAVSNFEYVLSFGCIVFAVIVPILTMRVIAEERKQKTVELMYALPVSTVQVVLGKYMALLMVFAAPMALICLYPAIFAGFGDVYLPTAYGSLFAFFLLGAALIAVGVFLSSLTESQGLAAGLGIAVILLNYYSVSLARFVSATPEGSAIALCIFAFLLALLIRHLTKNENLAYGVGIFLVAATTAAFFMDSSLFEGLLPKVMERLSLFERFNAFVNGLFDVTAVVYDLSVIALFLFLSVQSLEKRRYN